MTRFRDAGLRTAVHLPGKVQEDVPMFSAYIVSAQAAVNKRLSNATPSVYGFFNNVEQWEITK